MRWRTTRGDGWFLGAGIGCVVTAICLVGTLAAGYVSNIVQVLTLAQADNLHAIFWVKLVGIFAVPLGVIMGIVGWFS